MLEKPLILLVILVLLLIFYLVISFSVGKNKQPQSSTKINNYLFAVRVLITILAIVGTILWYFS